jgi:peptidoglycan/LPS O-acetylase OafA/YrhL
LQIGRGFAALFVVLFHLNNSVWGIGKYFRDPFSQALGFGNAGVQFFFVLSGFIIYLVHADDIGVPEQFRRLVFKKVHPRLSYVLGSAAGGRSCMPFAPTVD